MGFSINAAIGGAYAAVIDDEIVASTITYPLIIHYDRRVGVRFRTLQGRDIVFVVDEYWGSLYFAIDLDTGDYAVAGTSTIPTKDGIQMLLAALFYYEMGDSRSINDSEMHHVGIQLLTGGNDNIAHFFWNYLGGASIYKSLTRKAAIIRIVQLS